MNLEIEGTPLQQFFIKSVYDLLSLLYCSINEQCGDNVRKIQGTPEESFIILALLLCYPRPKLIHLHYIF